MQIVQSVVIDNSKFNLEQAANWIIRNNFKIKKIDATKSSFRFRQISPATLRKKGYNNYKTVGAIEGINLIIAFNDAL
jgi:hypothetical protein